MRRRRFTYDGRRFVVDRGVFDPVRHLSGVAFAPHLPTLVRPGSRVLDLGTGCGLLAAAMARTAEVVATDVDPGAVACARRNLEGLAVDVRGGDLFDPVAGERFDLVVTNPPYEIGAVDDRTLGSPDFLARFGREVLDHAGRVVVAYPADDGDDLLAATSLPLVLWRRVPTRGLDLGIFVLRGDEGGN